MEIRRLTAQDAPALWQLRLEALENEPNAFAESACEHRESSVDAFAKRLACTGSGDFVLGAFDSAHLAGMAGFHREQRIKRRHRGLIWGIYVAPQARGQGIARAMLVRVIEQARALDGLRSIFLSVSETQPAARHLYQCLGFRSFGIEPRALLVDGNYLNEEHLQLDLDG